MNQYKELLGSVKSINPINSSLLVFELEDKRPGVDRLLEVSLKALPGVRHIIAWDKGGFPSIELLKVNEDWEQRIQDSKDTPPQISLVEEH